MKKFFAFLLTFFLVLTCLLTPISAEESNISGGCSTLDGTIPFLGSQKIVDNAVSAVLYEVNTDTLMYADNADEPLPPVSLAKILTV